MLKLDKLHAFYGKSHVLHGVTLDVAPGEIVALLGRNGSGRSTTAKAVMGLVDTQGELTWKGNSLAGLKPYEIAHRGIAYVPENRDIFPRLTVHQNLQLGQKAGARSPRWGFEDMYTLFPRLRERQHTEAGVLSGGEQQMLAIAKALLLKPEVLLIDELSLGLAPVVVGQLIEVVEKLRATGVTLVIVEQSLNVALHLAERAVFMEKGEIRFEGAARDLLDRDDVARAVFMGVGQ